MKFEKGHKKQGGRERGTGNKDLEPIRTAFRNFVEGNLKQVQKDYNDLDTAKDRLYFILNIAEYCIPKLQRTELTGEDGKNLVIGGFEYIVPQSENGSNKAKDKTNGQATPRIPETTGQDN